jgi:hypothetical protein
MAGRISIILPTPARLIGFRNRGRFFELGSHLRDHLSNLVMTAFPTGERKYPHALVLQLTETIHPPSFVKLSK